MTGAHLNPTALASLAADALDAVAESGGTLPETHPVAVELGALCECCQSRVNWYLRGAQRTTALNAVAHEAELKRLRDARSAEVDMAFARVASYQAEAEQAREDAKTLQARLDRQLVSGRIASYGAYMLCGSGAFALVATIGHAIAGWGFGR